MHGMNEQFNHGRGDEKAGVRILQSLPAGVLSLQSESTACGFIKRVFKRGSNEASSVSLIGNPTQPNPGNPNEEFPSQVPRLEVKVVRG